MLDGVPVSRRERKGPPTYTILIGPQFRLNSIGKLLGRGPFGIDKVLDRLELEKRAFGLSDVLELCLCMEGFCRALNLRL